MPSLRAQAHTNIAGDASMGKRLLHFLLPHWKLVLLGSICSVGVAATSLSVSAIAYYAFIALTHRSKSYLLLVCVGVVAVYFLRWFILMGQSISFGEVSQRVGVTLRMKIYEHLQSLSLSYFDSQRTGNLLSTFNNDVPVVQNGIMSIKDAVSSPVMVVGGFAVVIAISWKLTLICLVMLPPMAIAINRITKKLRAISLETQNRLGDVNIIAEETLSGARLVRAFGAEQREISRFEKSIQKAKDIAMSGVRRSALLSPTTDFIGAVGLAVAVWIGGMEVLSGHLVAASLVAFIACVDKIKTGVGGCGSLMMTWKQTQGGAERIFTNVLDVPAEVVDLPSAKPLFLKNGQVEYHKVSFGYRKDQVVLDNLSFVMRPGQVTAIVGPSGAGKSTMADLIPRFYDPTYGYISIDDQDVRGVTVGSLRSHMAIVPQETMIFGGTVRDNICYGRPDATDAQIVDAARAANAHEFIEQLQHGYGTIVGERGVMLSGGQRQRIAIARALLKDPRILILDEATSSLDENSQILVQEALEKLMEGRTTLVIAHRLSTIKNADLIVVLDSGQIIESGSHSDLLRLNGAYARLYETQFRMDDEDIPEQTGLERLQPT
jgi:ATP-binding cassette, subfamily B, bacterial MsbA